MTADSRFFRATVLVSGSGWQERQPGNQHDAEPCADVTAVDAAQGDGRLQGRRVFPSVPQDGAPHQPVQPALQAEDGRRGDHQKRHDHVEHAARRHQQQHRPGDAPDDRRGQDAPGVCARRQVPAPSDDARHVAGKTATVLVSLAVSGGMPTAISAEKAIRIRRPRPR